MSELSRVDRLLYASRLQALVGNHEEAIRFLSEAIELDPSDARLYRYRGHRKLSLRQFGEARADFEESLRLTAGEPDELEYYSQETIEDLVNLVLDQPEEVRPQRILATPEAIEENRRLHKVGLRISNYYHLALSHYFEGDYEAALQAFRSSLAAAFDDDSRIAINDWLYLTLLKLGRFDDAAAHVAALDTSAFEVYERDPYYLKRLRVYKGEVDAEQVLDEAAGNDIGVATSGYGLSVWFASRGEAGRAEQVRQLVLERGNRYGFGYIAAEVESGKAAAV